MLDKLEVRIMFTFYPLLPSLVHESLAKGVALKGNNWAVTLKLKSLDLVEYRKVVIMDSDTVALMPVINIFGFSDGTYRLGARQECVAGASAQPA